jgi:hypothetical protein
MTEFIAEEASVAVERVQLGVRLEKRMVKVLKALAEYGDITLAELLEDIVLHAFEGYSTFSLPESQERVKEFKRLYHMDYDVHASYRFKEA